jgi:hypothetical protein
MGNEAELAPLLFQISYCKGTPCTASLAGAVPSVAVPVLLSTTLEAFVTSKVVVPLLAVTVKVRRLPAERLLADAESDDF